MKRPVVFLWFALIFGATRWAEAQTEPLFTDNFTQVNSTWGQVVDGKLIVSEKANNLARMLYSSKQTYADADIRLTMAHTAGDDGQMGGLIFWADSESEHYLLVVQSDGQFAVLHRTHGKWLSVVSFRAAESLKKGLGQANVLRVVCNGQRATIFLNDKEAISFRGFPRTGGGRIGLYVEATKEATSWAFSNLQVFPVTPANPVPANEASLLEESFTSLDPAWGEPAGWIQAADQKLTAKPEPDSSSRRLYNGRMFDDATFRIKLRATAGQLDQPAGLVFWAADIQDCYVAQIWPDGGVNVARRTQNQWLSAVLYRKHPAVKVGLGEENELAVTISGRQATVKVNNQVVTTLLGYPPANGSRIGISADSGKEQSTWEFSALSAVSAPPRPEQPQVVSDLLYAQDFREWDVSWGEPDDVISASEQGLLMKLPPDIGRQRLYRGRLFGDIDARVTITAVAGIEGEVAGLMFWATDDSNYYVAHLTGDGQISITRRMRGKFMTPVSYKEYPAARKGVGVQNELRVVTTGPMATIYVNEQQLFSFRGDVPANGSLIGFRSESGKDGSTWSFSKLQVTKATAASDTLPIASADPTLLLADDFATLDPTWGYPSESLNVQNNALQFSVDINKTRFLLHGARLYDDFDYSATFAPVKAWTDQVVGLAFWADSPSNLSAFVAGADGSVYAIRRINGEWKNFNIFKNAGLKLQTAAGQPNEFRVVTAGETALLYINGVKIGTYKGTPAKGGGRLGLIVENRKEPTAWAVANLRVRTPLVMPELGVTREDGVLMTDDFRSLVWGPADQYQRLDHGHLLITPNANGHRGQFYTHRFQDIDLSVDLTFVSGNTPAAGPAFWASSSDEFYALAMQPNGQAIVTRKTGGRFLNPVPLLQANQVNKGLGQSNRIRIVTSGNLATVFINDQQVTTFRGLPPSSGSWVGYFAQADAAGETCSFSNLVVRQGPAPAASTTPPDPGLILADDFHTMDPAWGNSDNAKFVRDGKLNFVADANRISMKFFDAGLFPTADIRIKVTQAQGEPQESGGLLFWGSDTDNCHAVLFNSNGNVVIRIREGGKMTTRLATGQAAPKAGVGQTNELRLLLQDKVASIYVNGQFYGKIDAPANLPGHRIGIMGSAGKVASTWQFSDFEIRRAPALPTSNTPAKP